MKKLLVLIGFALILVGAVSAQSNGNSGNGSGNYSSVWGNWSPSTCNWLDCGGTLPQPLAMSVIRQARIWGQETFGLSLGQMIQKYNCGDLIITYIPVAPPLSVLRFRIQLGGQDIVVIIDAA